MLLVSCSKVNKVSIFLSYKSIENKMCQTQVSLQQTRNVSNVQKCSPSYYVPNVQKCSPSYYVPNVQKCSPSYYVPNFHKCSRVLLKINCFTAIASGHV